jgi:hypothetical protein
MAVAQREGLVGNALAGIVAVAAPAESVRLGTRPLFRGTFVFEFDIQVAVLMLEDQRLAGAVD